ncbi:unnamed protein product [Brassicogethes aeneus]|uniref:Uncharacterized protein n=1 Tax=Brassicogethes aeneus TaxID=1431903 RepID=A0A9P0AZ32_BRAAE|nr:unnamed protein product [Brassicogethes aeneus]
MASFLLKINSSAAAEEKEVIKAEELLEGEVYPIKEIKIVKGGFGDLPLVELEEFKVFLPKRMTEAVAASLQDLNTGKFGLVYLGKKEFKDAKYKPTPTFEIRQI